MPIDAYRTAKYCRPECARAANSARWKARVRPTKTSCKRCAITAPADPASPPKPKPRGHPNLGYVRHERTRGMLVCAVCDKTIPPEAAPNRKTCSDECQRIWRRAYIQDYHAILNDDPARREAKLARDRETLRGRRAARRLRDVKTIVGEHE